MVTSDGTRRRHDRALKCRSGWLSRPPAPAANRDTGSIPRLGARSPSAKGDSPGTCEHCAVCTGCEPVFTAVEVAIVHEEGVLMGRLRGEGLEGDDPYFLLQVADEYDEQDRSLGMDTYYSELSGQEASGYGGIDRVEVRNDCCHVLLSESGRQDLRSDAQVCIAYASPVPKPLSRAR